MPFLLLSTFREFSGLGEEGTVYLIPETNGEPDKWLRRNFGAMFENELEAWYTDRDFWPRDRSFSPDYARKVLKRGKDIC
jgi:hypothetical protein